MGGVVRFRGGGTFIISVFIHAWTIKKKPPATRWQKRWRSFWQELKEKKEEVSDEKKQVAVTGINLVRAGNMMIPT